MHAIGRTRTAVLSIAGSLAIMTFGTMGTALAADPASVSVSGPSVLTQDSDYAVTVSGGSAKVCRVQETSATNLADFSAPYSIPIGLDTLAPGKHTLTFASVDCSGYLIASTTTTVTVPVQVKAAPAQWVAPSAQDTSQRKLSLGVSAQQAPVTAKIMKGSTVVATLPARTSTSASWSWAPGSAPAGSYTVAVTSGGETASIPFGVARGWAQLGPAFPRCTTITWTYSSASQPKKAAGMETDVISAFARIHKATGITFKQVSSKGKIALGWKKLSGEDGLGGSTSQNGVAIQGQVWFDTGSDWVGRKGFGYDANDNPGRGGLITHEIGHALGLGHVTDKKQIMYPIASAGSPTTLASGDRAGLKALYNSDTC